MLPHAGTGKIGRLDFVLQVWGCSFKVGEPHPLFAVGHLPFTHSCLLRAQNLL